jgi:C1A family cysteine protease
MDKRIVDQDMRSNMKAKVKGVDLKPARAMKKHLNIPVKKYDNEQKVGEVGHDVGFGWIPDIPDFRDYTLDNLKQTKKHENMGAPVVYDMLKELNLTDEPQALGASSTNLKPYFSPVETQGPLQSCTANAGVGLVEYFQRRAYGKHIDASRLFLYKVTRNLLQWTGDVGAYSRTTNAALALFGVPPEKYWPYVYEDFDEEPPAFCYSFAQNYQAIQYYRLEQQGMSLDTLIGRIKAYIDAGLPSMFGFSMYSSVIQAVDDGKIPYPSYGENVINGHAVIAMGYDDDLEIKNLNGIYTSKGAFRIRNSWGPYWGDEGYGWLPYDYVTAGLTRDWWSLIQNEWVDTGKFGL